MSQAVLKNLIQEFGAAIGIPELETDEEHRCNLMFDDVAVSLELGGGDDSLFIYSLLGTIPDHDAEFYQALLHANHLLEGTLGSTLSVDPRNKNVVLIREERLEALRLPRLEAIVEDFVNIAEHWMEQLASGQVKRTPSVTAPTADVPSPDAGLVRV